ncbi:cytochrome P450 [Collybia nuda]|uniref:Cytochrome P450 n=1 Tax=Collybia nuda TaxID=64659 RepID=A0A9P5Y726_9AGAR|nr:cytochrome P450 [Collybia nuda]
MTPSISLGSLICLVLGSTFLLSILNSKRRSKDVSLPPGPKQIPILGNITDFAHKELWLTVTNWARKYGDVCYLRVFGWNMVFLSSVEAADDLLEKRGAIYSDRPTLLMCGELCGVDHMLPFLKYNDTFKRQRRYTRQTLGARNIPAYHPMIRVETSSFLSAIVNDPSDYLNHIRKYAGGLTLSVVYGYRIKNNRDQSLVIAEECLDILANEVVTGSGIWPVDILPFLLYLPSWLPGAGFKRKAAAWKKKMVQFTELPFASAKAAAREGSILPSFCSRLLGDGDIDPILEADVKQASNSMYAASADTTVSSISQFLLAMTLYPGVMKKAQEEIDRVVGSDRLPDFTDREALPYLEAVMSEMWRWGSPVPLNLPHCLSQDDIYRNMLIPKGSIVIVNIWSILNDETLFPNPEIFDPDRFAPDIDPTTRARRDPRKYVFGFGRRRCPGADLVESSVWLLLASMIATLDIQKVVDDNEKVIEPVVRYSNSTFRVPDKFRFSITPRSEKASALFNGELV